MIMKINGLHWTTSEGEGYVKASAFPIPKTSPHASNGYAAVINLYILYNLIYCSFDLTVEGKEAL